MIMPFSERLCDEYKAGEAAGTLCPELCDDKSIVVDECQTHHFVKEAVFSAIWKTRGEVDASPNTNCLH